MFRTIAINFLLSAFLPVMFACGKAPDPVKPDPVRTEQGGEQEDKNDTAMPETIKISISGKTLPVKIEHNAAAEALIAALREAPSLTRRTITADSRRWGRWDGLCPPATRRLPRRREM